MSDTLALSLAQVINIMDQVAVAEQATVYSDPFVIEADEYFSIFVKGVGTAPHLKIIRCYNFSKQGTPEADKWAEMGTDGTEDELVADFEKKVWTINTETLKYAVWVRYKITGLITNSANTTLSMVIVKQKK